MAKSVGQLQINITAATAQAIFDLEKLNGSFVKLGGAAKQSGKDIEEGSKHGVSQIQAISGAIRVAEGGFTNNLRAAERFLSIIPGLGTALQSLFPLIGGIAFAGLVVKTGEEVNKFFHGLAAWSDKTKQEFASLNSGIRLTSDQLDLSNAKVRNQIARLEGRPENGLAIMLGEARVAADKLGESLESDLQKLKKLLDENQASIPQQILGRVSDKGIREKLLGKDGFGGVQSDVDDIVTSGRLAIDAAGATTGKGRAGAINSAVDNLQKNLTSKYGEYITFLNGEIETRKKNTQAPFDINSYHSPFEDPSFQGFNAGKDNADFIKYAERARDSLKLQQNQVPKNLDSFRVGTELTNAEEAERQRRLARVPQNKLEELASQLAGEERTKSAAGGTQQQKSVAQGQAEGLRQVESLNKELSRQPGIVGAAALAQRDTAKAGIEALEAKIAQVKYETQIADKLGQQTREINQQVKGENLLTAAVGKGYEEVKKAAVEQEVIGRLGDRYGTGSSDEAVLRAKLGEEYEARHQHALAETNQTLTEQITLSNRVTQAQAAGARAVALAELQVKTELMAQRGEWTNIGKVVDEFWAREANKAAQETAKINEQTAAVLRLTAAYARGTEAVKNAEEINKEVDAIGKGATPEELDAIRRADRAARGSDTGKAAAERANSNSNRLAELAKEKAALEDQSNYYLNEADRQEAIRKIQDEQLEIMKNQTLEQGKLTDGVKAFFIEMQERGKTAGQSVFEALNKGLDSVSGNLTKLLTGQKTDFGKSFKNIGEGLLNDSIKGGLQKGLGALGKLGVPGLKGLADKLTKKDGQTADTALWVQMAGGGANSSDRSVNSLARDLGQGGLLNGNGGLLGTGQVPLAGSAISGGLNGIGGYLGKVLGGLFGGGKGGDGLIESVASSVTFPGLASGGDVTAGQTYEVGENGPELFKSGVGGTIANAAQTRQAFSGGDVHNYTIDARGTDPNLTGLRVEQAIKASHSSAVSTSVRANADNARRTPTAAGGK